MRHRPTRINRLAQVARFLRVARLLLWTIWVIYRERRRVIRAHQRGHYEVQPDIEVLIKVLTAFRETAIKLGVLMIKLGQFLSARADLLPEQALQVLGSLQDEVPPAPFSHVVSVIEADLGKPVEQVFSLLERKATAAASLGQVHRATLAGSGETVAVKVQRPHIEELVNTDLSTIRFVIWVISRFVDTSEFIDLMAVYREFRRTVYEEIDYLTEAANARRFRELFRDQPQIYIPRVYEEYSSKRVLVLEWIDGIKINDYAALEAAGYNRLEIARRTVEAYFFQFFEAGFFHADPHPGNIFVKRGSPPDDPVIAFVDFGMVGTLTKSMKKAMRDLFLAFVARDSQALVNALGRLGFLGENANLTAIEHGLELMLNQYYGLTLGEARELDLSDVAQDIEQLLYGQPFQIPAQFAFTGRAISVLAGVATGLAPEFNLIDVATPYARKFLGLSTDRLGENLQELLRQLLENGRAMLTLPRSLERIITRLESGQIEIRLADSPTNGRNRRARSGAGPGANGSERRGGTLSLTLVSLSALAASVYLLTSVHLLSAGWFCLGLAAVAVLGLLLRR
ncbi:MAG: AarF/ABC1/UbiB kinase family protein [Thermogemmatispora sp.]|jgi:predicted unusual protein kinase regulating ubiquinone biosynthesis (AarF/ABC1/UbiB family)|uniref:ABC1 kinase family protein n=1 Tax=Thermogemmatispora TaxID=768669 RepID=UPI00124C2CE8|nr:MULTISPECIES: AarF/UbiB family protein [Thermogemmatispora]MBE3567618.1 AarF/ABC1/UbiB kinase family protein [Thermogemmatispora sp.]